MANTKKLIQAAAGNAGGAGLDVDEVYSTFLYVGNASSTARNFVNNVDISTEGGMVWTKGRSTSTQNAIVDTERMNSGRMSKVLNSDSTSGAVDYYGTHSIEVMTPSTTGYELKNSELLWNANNQTFVSRTFRKAPKFFDIQTWTGNSTSGRTISHNLDAEVGCIIVKRTDVSDDWTVFHRSVGNTAMLQLNKTNAAYTDSSFWNNTSPTTTEFTLGDSNNVNENNSTYVAYLFAHNDDDGEFGPNADEDIIKCGQLSTGTGSSRTEVELGFEPQFVMIKNKTSTASGNWWIFEDKRVFAAGNGDDTAYLYADSSSAEGEFGADTIFLTSNGFGMINNAFAENCDFVYIAIARGSLNQPEAATDVFDITSTSQDTSNVQTDLDRIDVNWQKKTSSEFWFANSRLRGNYNYLKLDNGAAEAKYGNNVGQFATNGEVRAYTSASNYIYSFKRARGFFDCVVQPMNNNQFQSDGAANNYNCVHNLGVTPEFIVVKDIGRAPADGDFFCYHSNLGTSKAIRFNEDGSDQAASWAVNENNFNFYSFANSTGTAIAWMWASLAGISKVGSYTGTGGYVLNDCGFSNGARLILIKRTDASGDWYLWDAERGITSGNDPYYLINSSNANVTNTDYIATDSSGFYVSFNAPAALNASGGNYIFLAIAN